VAGIAVIPAEGDIVAKEGRFPNHFPAEFFVVQGNELSQTLFLLYIHVSLLVQAWSAVIRASAPPRDYSYNDQLYAIQAFVKV